MTAILDMAGIRAALAEVLEETVPDGLAVSRGGIDGSTAMPVLVIGQPKVDLEDPACIHTMELPVAVVAARDGTSDQAVIDTLDGLLGAVIGLFLGLEVSAADLSGTVNSWSTTRTQFGTYAIGGTSFPAHLIFLTIHAR